MRLTSLVAVLVMAVCAAPTAAQIAAEVVADDLGPIVALVPHPTVGGGLLVLNKNGLVRAMFGGALAPEPFLDLRGQVATVGEQGLLHLAFAPDTATTRRLFVSFSNLAGDTVVARFTTLAANPLRVDTASRFDLRWSDGARAIAQPTTIHHGGQMVFGQAGYLYIAFGDGGTTAGIPSPAAQQPWSLLGKMVRLDVGVDDAHPGGYTVPPDNPFASVAGVLPEIWSFGFRNPWRWSIDDAGPGASHAMLIGDVGETRTEEIDYEPAGGGGGNYGWPLFEGREPVPVPGEVPLFAGPATPPVLEYGRAFGRAVIGGYVYRGTALPAMFRGRYFFGDFSVGRIWSAGPVPDGTPNQQAPFILEHTSELGGPITGLSSFARDLDGELYALSVAGAIHRIVPGAVSGAPTDLSAAVSGSTVRLTWLAGRGALPTGYVIEAGSAPGLADIARFTVGAIPSLEVPGAPTGRYFLRVRALRPEGESAPSPETIADVGPGCGGPPGAPTGLDVSLAGRLVTLTWMAPEPGVTGYLLEAGSQPGSADLASIALGPDTGFTAEAPPFTYHVAVRAMTACGVGPRSADIVVVVP